jgi:hypothetical protein
MFELETKELKVSKELEKKIELLCRFASTKYELILEISKDFAV